MRNSEFPWKFLLLRKQNWLFLVMKISLSWFRMRGFKDSRLLLSSFPICMELSKQRQHFQDLLQGPTHRLGSASQDSCFHARETKSAWRWQLMPVIPAFRRRGEEECCESGVSLGYRVRPGLNKPQTTNPTITSAKLIIRENKRACPSSQKTSEKEWTGMKWEGGWEGGNKSLFMLLQLPFTQ